MLEAHDTNVVPQKFTTMEAAYKYLKEFVRTMGVIQADIRASYDVEGFGKLVGLKQGNYKVSYDYKNEIILSFDCSKPEKKRCVITDTPAGFLKRKNYLVTHGLQADTEDSGSAGWGFEKTEERQKTFDLERRVPAEIRLTLDEETQHITLLARNIAALGEERYGFKLEQLDDRLLLEFTQVVLRKPNKIAELIGFRLNESTIKGLRAKLQEEACAKEQQLEEQGKSNWKR